MKPRNREEWIERRHQITLAMKALGDRTVHGCGDGNCLVRRTAGMHTNGGCRCYKQVAEEALNLAAMADEIKNIVGFS